MISDNNECSEHDGNRIMESPFSRKILASSSTLTVIGSIAIFLLPILKLRWGMKVDVERQMKDWRRLSFCITEWCSAWKLKNPAEDIFLTARIPMHYSLHSRSLRSSWDPSIETWSLIETRGTISSNSFCYCRHFAFLDIRNNSISSKHLRAVEPRLSPSTSQTARSESEPGISSNP